MPVLKLSVDEYGDLCCSECGIIYFVPSNFLRRKRNTHDGFYCPNGHNQYFPAETEAEKLKRQLEVANRRIDSANARADMANNSARAYKGQLTKIKNRISNGVCPCCNRSFWIGVIRTHCRHMPIW